MFMRFKNNVLCAPLCAVLPGPSCTTGRWAFYYDPIFIALTLYLDWWWWGGGEGGRDRHTETTTSPFFTQLLIGLHIVGVSADQNDVALKPLHIQTPISTFSDLSQNYQYLFEKLYRPIHLLIVQGTQN